MNALLVSVLLHPGNIFSFYSLGSPQSDDPSEPAPPGIIVPAQTPSPAPPSSGPGELPRHDPVNWILPPGTPKELKDKMGVKTPGSVAAKSLTPLLFSTIDEALANAAKRNHPVLLVVTNPGEPTPPALLKDPSVARASRMILSLVCSEFLSEEEFFKSRRLHLEKLPCHLILDPLGNVFDILPGDAESRIVLAGVRNANSSMTAFRSTLAEILPRAEERASAGQEGELLSLARPYLKRHFRGYPEIDRLVELVNAAGRPRLEAARDIDTLTAIAREFEHTPIEAAALLAIANRHRESGNEAQAKALFQKILNDLPWPENADVHQQVRAVLGEYRRAEIKRRREEIERQRRAAEWKKILDAVGRPFFPWP